MANVGREPLHGEVEVDEAWIGGTRAGLRGSRQLRGRKAVLIVVAVEKRGRATGRARMAVIPDFRGETLIAFLRQNVLLGSVVCTDALNSFSGLDEAGFRHVPRTQPTRAELHRDAESAVPLAHRAIGNLKQWLLGTHHGVGRHRLQAFLDELVFRHNRRKQPMAAFLTLLGLGTGHKSATFKEMRRVRSLPIRKPKADHNILWFAKTTG